MYIFIYDKIIYKYIYMINHNKSTNCDKFIKHKLIECNTYNNDKKIFYMDKNGEKQIIEITPDGEDVNTLRNKFSNGYKMNYLIKITKNPSDVEMIKYKKNYLYILIKETPQLYNVLFKQINIDNGKHNKYITNYGDILKKYMNQHKNIIPATSYENMDNLFNYYNHKNFYENMKSEIPYYLQNSGKKLRICFNIFNGFYILLLPNILGNYNINYDKFYCNQMNNEYELEEIIKIFEKHVSERTRPNQLFNKSHETPDIKNYMKFRYHKYWNDLYKCENVNYMCMIIPMDNTNMIYNIRDLNKNHINLLKYIYRLSNHFIYDLYGYECDMLRMYMRVFSDTYGCVYFKIESMTPFNYYTVKQGSHDKEIDITTIIYNLINYDDYYKKVTFEYNLSYVQYKNNKKLFEEYFNNKYEKNNIGNIKNQILILDNIKIELDKKLKLCNSKNELRDKKYPIKTQTLSMHYNNKPTLCENTICMKCHNNTLIIEKKKFKIIRVIDNRKKYILICKCEDKFYSMIISPKYVRDNYTQFLSAMCNVELLFNNNNFELWKTDIKNTKNYYDSYVIEDIQRIVPDNFLKNPKYQKFFDTDFRSKSYDTQIIQNQIQFHLQSNIYKPIEQMTDGVKMRSLYEEILLGIKEILIKINTFHNYDMFDFFYISNNKKFIMVPDLKWFGGMDNLDKAHKILNDPIKSFNTHYTAWYNPYYEDNCINVNGKNIFRLWNNKITFNNQHHINPLTFIDIINSTSNDEYSLYRNIHKFYNINKSHIDKVVKLCGNNWDLYKSEYIYNQNTNEITKLLLEFYKEKSNLDIIYKKNDVIHSIKNVNEKNYTIFDNLQYEFNNFLNNKYNNKIKILSYIHNTVALVTYLLHIHFVTDLIEQHKGDIFEINYTALKLYDVENNLKTDPNYYTKYETSYMIYASYYRFYSNVTDHCDPLLENYPYYPTFALKVIDLDGINVIYPTEKATKSILNINYDVWKENKSLKDIYLNKEDLLNRLDIMKLYIKKRVIQFIDRFANKKDKKTCIDYFKQDFFGSNLKIEMWKDNMSNAELINLFYKSLGLEETLYWFVDFYWDKSIQTFYKNYCETYNEVKKIPFTLDEWMHNTNIHDVFFDKKIYDFHTSECEVLINGKQFFEEQWTLNYGIRVFYNNFITKFKKDCDVKSSDEIEKMVQDFEQVIQ